MMPYFKVHGTQHSPPIGLDGFPAFSPHNFFFFSDLESTTCATFSFLLPLSSADIAMAIREGIMHISLLLTRGTQEVSSSCVKEEMPVCALGNLGTRTKSERVLLMICVEGRMMDGCSESTPYRGMRCA